MTEVFKLKADPGKYYPPIVEDWSKPGLEYWGKHSCVNIPLQGRMGYRPEFPPFHLHDLADLTDHLTSSTTSKVLMVSKRVFDLWQQFKIDEYQCFEEIVHTKSKSVPYFLLYLPTPRDDEFVDWQHSIFADVTKEDEKKLLMAENANDYYKICNGRIIKVEKLYAHLDTFDLDLFRCQYFHGGDHSGKHVYISSRLKKAMDEIGITGFNYIPLQCYVSGE